MENKKIITEDIRKKLRADFPKEAYKQHPTKKFLTTLKAMYVTERLNDVFGVGRWTINHEVVERTESYVLVQGEFESLDFDVRVPKQYGGHNTAGTNVEIADGYKSAITDCISKIASYLEIGIEMFKGNITVSQASNKKEDNTPVLWMNEKQFKKALEGDKENIQKTIDWYDGKTLRDDNGVMKKYLMKKTYKDQLTAKL